MTSIDRAENIIYEAITGDGFSAPELRTRHAARALADAGLLAPDLPPVTVDDLDRLSVAVGPASPGDARDTRMGSILLEDGLIFTTGVPNPYRSTTQAGAHALAILAMCDHAEAGAPPVAH